MNEKPIPTTAIHSTQTAAPLTEPKYKGVVRVPQQVKAGNGYIRVMSLE
jgi:hypothetical protein